MQASSPEPRLGGTVASYLCTATLGSSDPHSQTRNGRQEEVSRTLYVVLRAFILFSHVYFSLISKKGLSIIIAGKRVDRPSLVFFHLFLWLTINIRDDIALLKSSSIIVTQWPMAGHNDTSTEQHDLSPYELLRLTKIRRNADRLAALGLGSSIATSAGRKAPVARKRPRPKETNKLPARPPTRLSKRLRDRRVKGNREFNVLDSPAHALDREQDDDVSCTTIDYSKMPQEPDQLDDYEFQIYASLRRWRLHRKDELEIEAYKICQNRTLCELIRRARNDQLWGVAASDDGKDRSSAVIADDLVQCWGLGQSKVRADGFGPEMMRVIEGDENTRLLQASRRHIGNESKS